MLSIDAEEFLAPIVQTVQMLVVFDDVATGCLIRLLYGPEVDAGGLCHVSVNCHVYCHVN